MKLGSLKPSKGATSSKKRVGRGHGSGLGRNAGRGDKAVSYTHLTLPPTPYV